MSPYTRDDFGNDMGDSVVTETIGWGAFIMSNRFVLETLLCLDLLQ